MCMHVCKCPEYSVTITNIAFYTHFHRGEVHQQNLLISSNNCTICELANLILELLFSRENYNVDDLLYDKIL